MTPQEMKDKKACFYTLPQELTKDQVDPLIQKAVFRINESGWVWTAESCQGHPDADCPFHWAHNTSPMLRLICDVEHFGRMLQLLLEASTWEMDHLQQVHTFEITLCKNWGELMTQQTDPGFREVLVSIRASTVWERNKGLDCFCRFAESVNDKKV
jgi:hypothetical protein